VTVNLILIGFGNVGQGLAEILNSHAYALKEKYGLSVKVKAIVDRSGAAVSETGIDLANALEVKRRWGAISAMKSIGKPGLSAIEVIEESNGDIVIEATSNNLESGEPGLTHIRKALKTGKHVITTNKGPLALALPQLLEIAHRNNVELRFSGAVGGAMPILDFARRCLCGDEILSIRGVLNGTTNYILWSMSERGITMSEAIAEARKLGYAEENISYDVGGLDTASKLVIIANWVMDYEVSLKDVNVKGIESISLEDVMNAKREGSAIRLIGSISHGKIKVSPEIMPLNNPLCVNSNLNAVVFECVYSGQHLIIGRGAGGKETASSIMRDIINIVASRNVNDHKSKKILRMSRGIEISIRNLCN
jgi:homoserine dehydrogenase